MKHSISTKTGQESVSRNVSKKPRRSFIGIQTRRGFCPTLANGVVQQPLAWAIREHQTLRLSVAENLRAHPSANLRRGHPVKIPASRLGWTQNPGCLRVSGDLCILRFKIFRRSGITVAFKTTFEVFTRVGSDNSLERLTERSVGLVTDRPSDVYELFVTLL